MGFGLNSDAYYIDKDSILNAIIAIKNMSFYTPPGITYFVNTSSEPQSKNFIKAHFIQHKCKIYICSNKND